MNVHLTNKIIIKQRGKFYGDYLVKHLIILSLMYISAIMMIDLIATLFLSKEYNFLSQNLNLLVYMSVSKEY